MSLYKKCLIFFAEKNGAYWQVNLVEKNKLNKKETKAYM
ncbi:hypothetical protein AOR13_3710 [Alteromonas stellipolaris LMG 21856]|nr:hypothetical protein AOR13_3710 [Alteromonas stellipolaris LMG 21856]